MRYDGVVDKIRDGCAYVLFPADPPTSSTLKSNDLKSKDIACKSRSLGKKDYLTTTDHEFNAVIKEFCDGFENPKVHNTGDIIK